MIIKHFKYKIDFVNFVCCSFPLNFKLIVIYFEHMQQIILLFKLYYLFYIL